MLRAKHKVADVAATGAPLHDDQVNSAATSASVASAGDHPAPANHTLGVPALAPTISEIRYWHRQRVFAMDQRKRSDLALGAFIRSQLGWSRALAKADSDAISERAADLVSLGEKVAKGKATGIGDSVFAQWSPVILASIRGRAHWDAIESAATKEMERLASSLPVWTSFGEGVRGFGARSLAVIIGETGDIGSYATVAKLWKRMGLAVMNGVRQGGLRKTASAEDWIAHGYSARRRSYMFVIGDVLVKNKGTYREVYLARKEYERVQAVARGLIVAPSAKIPAARKAEFISDGHIHKRSQRYMEKRLLRDLWQEWRRTISTAKPMLTLSAATPSAQAERSARVKTQPDVQLPSVSTRQTRDRVKPIATSSGKRRTAHLSKPNADVSAESLPAKAGKRRASHAPAPKGRMPAAKSSARAP